MEKSQVKEKKSMKTFGKVLLVILLILIIIVGICVGIGVWYVNDKLGKVNYVEIASSDIEVTEGVEEKMNGYRTIAIFGVDSRSNELITGTRSDCIILATIDEKTKEVKLTSVYRDTYLELTGRSLDKVTHAYAYGRSSTCNEYSKYKFRLKHKRICYS